jgi:hypothetical protein
VGLGSPLDTQPNYLPYLNLFLPIVYMGEERDFELPSFLFVNFLVANMKKKKY